MVRREVVHVFDILSEEWISTKMKQRAKDGGFRAIMCAPPHAKSTYLNPDGAAGTLH